MSQPPAYSRAFSFTNFQAANPSLALPGSQVDLELNNAKATLDAVLNNLALVQRDDGGIKNASVGYDQLKTEVVLGFNAPVVWTTGTAYAANSSIVFNGSGFYRCLVAHTSGVFATDLAAAKWQLIVNLAGVPLVSANQIAVTPSGSLTTDVQTSLQALDTGKAALSHTQLSSTISDSTAAGRALLTAADATTQNTLLGTTSLGFQSGDIKETACPVLQTGWYYCDGSNKNRVTDVNLFNAITIQQTGTTTSASAVVTGLSDTSNMSPGMFISGTGIPAAAQILSIDSSTQITLTANATGSSTTPLVIAPYGVGDGSTTFGLPNRAYLAVGRDNASGSATNINQVSTTFSITTGTAAATVASATGLFVGMTASAPKLPLGTAITAISGTSVTLSNNATGTVSGGAIRFSPLLDAQTLGAKGGALSRAITLAQIPTGITSTVTQTISMAMGGLAFPALPTASATIGNFPGASTGSTATPQPYNASANSVQWQSVSALNSGAITISPTSNNTLGQLTPNASPTIVMNYIIKR